MLTIKENAVLISGLSAHTVRKLVEQGKIKYVRTSEGKRGKILVNKADLIAYFNGVKCKNFIVNSFIFVSSIFKNVIDLFENLDKRNKR